MTKMEKHGQPTDPYRIFFPLGILMGISGVLIWPLYHWGITAGYSGRSHAFIQTDCFVYAFIVGFLWTAIPKFTGTRAPSLVVQYFVAAVLIAEAVCFELQYFSTAHLLFLATHLILIAVAANCFIHRQHPPPETFVLVGLGLLAGLIAAVLNAGIALEFVAPALDMVGRRLMTEGMVLLLVLGVGGFLGPRLLGFAELPNFQNIGKLTAAAKPSILIGRRWWIYAISGIAILASVIVEYGWKVPQIAVFRAAIVSALVLVNAQPWRRPVARTTLAWCVWTAHWLLIASVWLITIAPKYRTDFLHVMFMGGFTLLILAIGTRVVLSHGGHGPAEERKSWPLRISLTSGLIAMSARLAAPFVPNSYFSHLAWAAVLWIGGMLVWGTYVFLRIRHAPSTL